MALFTAAPSDAGGGTEASGGSYARAAVVRHTTNFPTTTNDQISNAVAIAFPQATAAWGVIVAVGIFDAASAGNLLFHGALAAPITVNSGGLFNFAINALTLTEA